MSSLIAIKYLKPDEAMRPRLGVDDTTNKTFRVSQETKDRSIHRLHGIRIRVSHVLAVSVPRPPLQLSLTVRQKTSAAHKSRCRSWQRHHDGHPMAFERRPS